MEYLIKQYALQQGALEIQYIEEFFLDFPRKKTASEVIQRLSDRDHQILMAEAALPSDPGMVVPVSFKVSHELRATENDPKQYAPGTTLRPPLERLQHVVELKPDVCSLDLNTMNSGPDVVINTPANVRKMAKAMQVSMNRR